MRGDYMLSAVTRAVTAEFAKKPPTYKEIPQQGAKLPYLFVHELQQEQGQVMRYRWNRACFFDVRYHPDDKKSSAYRDFTEVRERLFCCLQRIDTDDLPVRASSLRSEIVDGVLHVFVEYPIRVMLPEPKDPEMQTLDLTENMKE